jgi:hypothetical protein
MKKIIVILFLFNSYPLFAQIESGKDSTAFLDSIMNEMDDILDQMTAPKSFFSAGLGAGTGFFNFKNTSSTFQSQKKLLLSPTAGFFHKSGLGISATGYAVSEKNNLNPYQLSVTPSYDYIERRKLSVGFAYTKYFTKEDLSFYTTPIENEVSAYFNYKKSWIQPGISVAYGWGSKTEYEHRKLDILWLRKVRDPLLITSRKEESVTDLSVLLSIRHDFNKYSLLFSHDLLVITPVLLLSSGTQKFGFNTSFSSRSKVASNFLPGNQYIKDKSGFEPQSASCVIRADYSVGIFFVQSQVLVDYYLHPATNRLNNAFAVIAGINL